VDYDFTGCGIDVAARFSLRSGQGAASTDTTRFLLIVS